MDSNRPTTAPGINQGQPHGVTSGGGTPPATPAGSPRPTAPGIILPTNPAAGPAATPVQPPRPASPNRIQHTKPGFGSSNAAGGMGSPSAAGIDEAMRPINRLGEDAKPLPVAEGLGMGGMGSKITAFGERTKRHEDSWTRSPNTTGSGAIHVKTFHCKLTDDALTYLDQTINEWLDAHPQYEVKFVSTSIGIMTGKLKEPAIICQVWV